MSNSITDNGLWLECRNTVARWNAKLQKKIYEDKQRDKPWSTSLLFCFEPLDTCCLTAFCPCMTFGKTYHRIHHKGDMSEYQKCNLPCLAFYIGMTHMPCLMPSVMCRQSYRIRKLGDIKGNIVQDYFKSWWCCCLCSLVQNEKESKRLFGDSDGGNGVVYQQPTSGAGQQMSMISEDGQHTNTPQHVSELAPTYFQQSSPTRPSEGQTNGAADPTVAPEPSEKPAMPPTVADRTSDSWYTDYTDNTIRGGGIPTPVARNSDDHTSGLFMDKHRFMSSGSVLEQDTSDNSDDTVEAPVMPTPVVQSHHVQSEEQHADNPVTRKYTSDKSVLLDQGTLESSTTDYSDNTSEETGTKQSAAQDQIVARDPQQAGKHPFVDSVVLDQGTLELGEESW